MLHVAPVFQEYDTVRTIPLQSDTLNSQSSDEHSANGEMYLRVGIDGGTVSRGEAETRCRARTCRAGRSW